MHAIKRIIHFALGAILSLASLQAAQQHFTSPIDTHQATALLETQIRGFYNQFLDAYKSASPLNGLLALHMLAEVRFKGRYGKQIAQCLCHYQITNPAEGHQPTSHIDCPLDNTSAIVQHFFPSPAGGILRMPALENIDLIARMDINATGELLKIYVLYKTRMAEAGTDVNKKQVLKEYFDKFKVFFEERIQTLEHDQKAKKILSEQWKKADIALSQLPEHYATMFTQAYFEQNHYPAHLVEYTLLAYAWKKAKTREQLLNMINGPLKEFIQAKSKDPLQPKVKIPPFSEQLYWQWKDEAVKENKLKSEKFQEWIKDPEKLIFMTIGYHLFENKYPKMLDYGKATYSHTTRKIPMADCGETSLRDFINFLIAIAESKLFDTEILKIAFPNIMEQVIEFYKTIQPRFQDVLGIEKDRNAWVNSISGLKEVAPKIRTGI